MKSANVSHFLMLDYFSAQKIGEWSRVCVLQIQKSGIADAQCIHNAIRVSSHRVFNGAHPLKIISAPCSAKAYKVACG